MLQRWSSSPVDSRNSSTAIEALEPSCSIHGFYLTSVVGMIAIDSGNPCLGKKASIFISGSLFLLYFPMYSVFPSHSSITALFFPWFGFRQGSDITRRYTLYEHTRHHYIRLAFPAKGKVACFFSWAAFMAGGMHITVPGSFAISSLSLE
ncbi:hypothetical protein LY76DRAFT_75079 [Colletotrichum caudatum]|nr:hypothetical protein LY76DRAFT_75079 [Colletotrichum caudatum]